MMQIKLHVRRRVVAIYEWNITVIENEPFAPSGPALRASDKNLIILHLSFFFFSL